MFGHNQYYHGTIRKSIIIFGNIFNDIWIERLNDSGGQDKLFKVPLQYGAKDPAWVRTDADPGIDRPAAVVLPRMTFQEESFTYNPDRKIPTTRYYARKNPTDLNSVKFQYAPVPYDIVFALNIYANEIADANKIVEQILPFFTPEFTITADMIPEMDIEKTIPLVLIGNSRENIDTGSFADTRRSVIWTLNFKMNTNFYGPIIDRPIIKLSNTNFYVGNTTTSNTPMDNITVTPGLDSNGNPTSNVELSINTDNIAIDSNFGYVIQRTDLTGYVMTGNIMRPLVTDTDNLVIEDSGAIVHLQNTAI